MSRLTKYRADIQAYDYIELCGGISQAVTNKLGKLEDLEEQLGCPLDVVLIPYFISGLKKYGITTNGVMW